MPMSDPATPTPTSAPPAAPDMRRKVLVCFGLFAVFFVYYVGTAVVQTPPMRSVASIPVMGMPLGLLLSLCIFPVSWILIVVWFWKAR